MAVLPHTLLRSPLALICTLLCALLLGALFQSLRVEQPPTDNTKERYAVVISHGEDEATADICGLETFDGHSPHAYLVLLDCLARVQAWEDFDRIGPQALAYFPASEPLYNMIAFYEYRRGLYRQAVSRLSTGLVMVKSPQGWAMENNLAWSSLHIPETLTNDWNVENPWTMDLQRARNYYLSSLKKSPQQCEVLHTGLFVEYAISRYSAPYGSTREETRAEADKRYDELLAQYLPCLQRLGPDAPLHIREEIAGFALLEYARLQPQEADVRRAMRDLFRQTLTVLSPEMVTNSFCAQMVPIAALHTECDKKLKEMRLR